MNVGDKVWLPERLRTGPFSDLNAALSAEPGTVAELDGDWAMVEYPTWGQFGCPVAELTLAEFTCPRCQRTSYNPNDLAEGYCGACHDWTRT